MENREGDKSEGVEMGGGKGKDVVVVMDTPDRSTTQIAAPISEFEESPVSNFLNSLSPISDYLSSLSPIKPTKSVHMTHLNSTNFASLKVFSSPRPSSSKESSFLRRQQLDSNEQKENIAPGNYNGESGCAAEITSTSGAVVPFGPSTSGEGLYGNELSMEELNQLSGSGSEVGAECDWEMSEADLLSLLGSPENVGATNTLLDSSTVFYSQITDIQMLSPVQQGNRNEIDNPSTQSGDGSYPKEISVGASLENDIEGSLSNEPVPPLPRGMRRCLTFETGGGGCSEHFNENSEEGNTSSTNKQLAVPVRSEHDSSRHILPGIGLHLNALATAPKEYEVVNQDLVSGRLVIAPSSSMVNFHPFSTAQEQLNQPLPIHSVERDMEVVESAVPVVEHASQPQSVNVVAQEFNQSSSPKRKRRRPEQAPDIEGCKRCNCKKSKCLKLYCECFASSVYCMEPCSCQECFNKPNHEDTVLSTRKQIESRNPLAFAPKVIRRPDSLAKAGDDYIESPASSRHKRGCNCKKSGCLKKYCECYQAGVGCSINCRCEGCKNAFGRKGGSLFMRTEVEPENNETEVLEKTVKEERASHKTTTKNDIEQNPESAVHATPTPFARPGMQVPFSSKKKLPRSSLGTSSSIGTASLCDGSSSSSCGSQGLVSQTSFLPRPQPKFYNQFEAGAVVEDELPQILQSNRSPISGIKSAASPNSKRISPPQCAFGVSPESSRSRSRSRKLILQSIPSFPTLTPKH